MFLTLLKIVATIGGLFVGRILFQFIYFVVQNWLSHRQWRKKAPNIPEAPGYSTVFGHSLSMILNKDNWKFDIEYHEKLGKYVRLFMQEKHVVSCTDLNLIKRFIFDEPDTHLNRTNMGIPIEELGEHSLLLAKDDRWRRIRQATAPAFTRHKVLAASVMDEIEATIERLIDGLERRLSEAPKQCGDEELEVDSDNMALRYALDLCFTCFYKQPDIIDHYVEHDEWTEVFEENLRMGTSGVARVVVNFLFLNQYVRVLARSHLNPHGRLLALVLSLIRRQLRLNSEARELSRVTKGPNASLEPLIMKNGSKFRRNLMDYVIDRYHEGMLSEREYVHNSFMIIHAASKTMSDALAMLLVELARNQAIQEKLRKSILLEGTDSEYLNWVIHESLRLHPPILGGCMRAISTDMTTESGLFIPAGTTIVTPVHVINRLKEYWGEDADEFKPERWSKSKDFHPCQFLSFGAGRRGCLGREFAMISTRLLMVKLLQKFRFHEAREPARDDLFQAPFYLWLVFDKPLYVKVTRFEADEVGKALTTQL